MAHLIKIHHAPHKERLDFYRYCLAADSWCQARRALEQLRKLENEKIEIDDLTAYFVRVAFYTLYGRPFKQRMPLRIEGDIVPQVHMGLHRGALMLRDKMFAHSDQDLVSSLGDPLNTVTVDVKPRSFAFGSVTMKPLKGSITVYLELVEALIKTVVYRRDKIWRRWHKHLCLPSGTRWKVNFGPASNEVLKPTNKEARVFSHSADSK